MAFRPVTHYLAALLVLLAVCCCGTASAIIYPYRQDTDEFLRSFARNFPQQLTDWNTSNSCNWRGVNCLFSGEITVDLRSRGLNGYLPELYWDDDRITSIDLSINRYLQGNLPATWGRMKALKKLRISNTGLHGQVPDAWSGMTSLEEVTVSNTKACYGLPNWANMPRLRSLDLSNNNMGGRLADSWSTLTGLTSVYLGGNGFCGCEPESWKNVSVLHNAVSSLPVASSTCNTSNACTDSSYSCFAKNGSVGLVSTAVAVLSVACALLSVVAL